MSLEIVEQKWKYLTQKEKIIRDAYDTRLDHIYVLPAPGMVHNKMERMQKELMPRGYDPLKPCKSRTKIRIDRKEFVTKNIRRMHSETQNESGNKVKGRNKEVRKDVGEEDEFVREINKYLENVDKTREGLRSNFELLRTAKSRCKNASRIR